MKIILVMLLTIAAAFGETTPSLKRTNLTENETKVVLEVLQKNDVLFNAFLKKDPKAVAIAAAALRDVVSKSEAKALAEVKKTIGDLNKINAANSQEKNLASYEAFNNSLIKVVTTYNVGNKFNIFNCPMVKKSWIQNVDTNKDIRNVYAMEMLECGSQETHF